MGHIRQDDRNTVSITLNLLHSNNDTSLVGIAAISNLDVCANGDEFANLAGKEFNLGGIAQLGGIAGLHLDGGTVQTKNLAAKTN